MFKKYNQKILLVVSLFGVSIIALLAWQSMPIFPDEIAVRWLAGRYIQDNGIAQKLFHYCSGNMRETPVLFVVPALIFSWIDLFYSPVAIRILPFLITLSVVALSIFLTMRKGNPYAAVIATTAFVGVAGSGLVMARSEYIQVLNIACCLGAYYFIESGSKKFYLRYGLILILMLSVLMSLYSHIQGLLFLPLTLFMAFHLLSYKLGKSRTAILMVSLLLFVTYTTINLHKFSCNEHPEIVQYITDKVLNSEKIHSLGVIKYASMEIVNYSSSFLYKTFYQINYLPGIFTENSILTILLNVLNFGIVIIVLFNFCLFLYVAAIGSVFLIKKIRLKAGSINSSQSLETVLTLLLLVMPVLFMFFYDADKNFYRSFFINFLIAIVLAVVAARKFEFRIPTFFKFYFWVCGFVVVTSTVMNFWWFNNKLEAGFEGPSIAIKQDWKSVSQDVKFLAKECSMDLTKGKIVVDDMTYDSLKLYPYLYPITYLHLSAILTGVKSTDVIKKVKPNYILARCDSFRSADIYIQKSRGRICCQNLNIIERLNDE